jgi:hypothetical protein
MLAARCVRTLPLVCLLLRYCDGLLLRRGNGVDVPPRSPIALDMLATMAKLWEILRNKKMIFTADR